MLLFVFGPKKNPRLQVVETSRSAIELLKRMLVYNSAERVSAHEALLQPYFFTEPLPAHHSELPVPAPKCNDLDIIFLRCSRPASVNAGITVPHRFCFFWFFLIDLALLGIAR